MNKFDKIFVKKTKEVFDNHQEIYQPDDWEKLQVKMAKQNRGIVFFLPYIAKAASLILFLGLSTFIANRFEPTYLQTSTINTKIKTESVNNSKNQKTNNTKSETNKSTNIADNNNLNNIVRHNKIDKKQTIAYLNINNNEAQNSINKYANNNNDNISYDSSALAIFNNDIKFSNVKQKLQNYSSEIHNLNKKAIASDKPVMQIFDNEDVDERSNEKRLGFGIELASVSNYTTSGQGNGINVGGGVAANYKISNKFSFETGFVVAQQSLKNYQSNMDEGLYAEASVDMSKSGISDLNNVQNISSPEKKISLITVDIPLNVVYKFKKVSVSTGLSSLLCVNERLEDNYEVVVTNSVYNSATAKMEHYSNSTLVNKKENIISNHFDFAQLLNLSVGYSIDFKKNSIIIEPYVKLPLGSISSQEIYMGAGGVVLRYNFYK